MSNYRELWNKKESEGGRAFTKKKKKEGGGVCIKKKLDYKWAWKEHLL